MSDPLDLPRHIPLEGASNLRDLGGWPTRNGGTVRMGQIYRSAALHGLTDEDAATMHALGIRDVVDFRGDAERARWPTRLFRVTIHELTIAPTIGASLRDLVADPNATPGDVIQVMREAYAAYANDWHHRYRAMFDLLLHDDPAPLLFHCTAGKDRTGMAAALILSALGVEEEHIWADYLATNRLWRGDVEVAETLPKPVADMLLSANRAFLEAGFEAIAASHGDMDTYLADRLGLDTPRRAALRARLVA